jgi:hypothetical protein
MRLEFDTTVYRWAARTDSEWFFADVPADESAMVAEIPRPFARGFGAVRVQARVGTSTWRTSIFPGASGTYALPLKRRVRDAEGLVEGGAVHVDLEILDL